jgi:hypothetical protein
MSQTPSRPPSSADLIRMLSIYHSMCERLRIHEPLTRENVEDLLRDLEKSLSAGNGTRSHKLFVNLKRYIISKRP